MILGVADGVADGVCLYRTSGEFADVILGVADGVADGVCLYRTSGESQM